jgi:hypothetical protein
MALRFARGLFRVWIVGTALFVLAVAFVSYSEIKQQFDADAEPKTLATSPDLADWVYRRFYSDMPREQFDKKITALKPITEPEVIAQLVVTVHALASRR